VNYSRLRRISAIAGAVALALAVLLPATAAAASTWNYSCQTASADFKYDGAGYSGYGETVHLTARGCWTATSTSTSTFSQATTRSWEDDGTFYKDSYSSSSSSMHAGNSVFSAKYHVSVWYTSECELPLPFLCVDYGAAYAMYPNLQLIPINPPGYGNWTLTSSCSFVTGSSWVSNCAASTANFVKGPITVYWISGPAS
jgi:hypothetical protein